MALLSLSGFDCSDFGGKIAGRACCRISERPVHQIALLDWLARRTACRILARRSSKAWLAVDVDETFVDAPTNSGFRLAHFKSLANGVDGASARLLLVEPFREHEGTGRLFVFVLWFP